MSNENGCVCIYIVEIEAKYNILQRKIVERDVEVKEMRKERTQRIRDDLDGRSMSVEEALVNYILLYDQICCKMNPSPLLDVDRSSLGQVQN